MNKLRKVLPYILMVWPYVFIPVAMLYGLEEDGEEFTAIIIYAYIFLTFVIYIANICNAFMRNNTGDEKKYASKLAFYGMVIKLVHIPFYLFVFVIGFIALAVMVVPAFALFSPFIIFMLFIIDSALMLTSSMYGISASYRAAKTGVISREKAVIFSVFYCFFVSDVISAVLLRIKLKKADRFA